MSKTSRTSVTVPAQAKKGAIIEIRAIAQHDMESGFRYTEGGKIIPRDIIRTFTCTYNQVEVFKADFYPGIGASRGIPRARHMRNNSSCAISGEP
jgi:sulfur-oxidizing protein SoxZ